LARELGGEQRDRGYGAGRPLRGARPALQAAGARRAETAGDCWAMVTRMRQAFVAESPVRGSRNAGCSFAPTEFGGVRLVIRPLGQPLQIRFEKSTCRGRGRAAELVMGVRFARHGRELALRGHKENTVFRSGGSGFFVAAGWAIPARFPSPRPTRTAGRAAGQRFRGWRPLGPRW